MTITTKFIKDNLPTNYRQFNLLNEYLGSFPCHIVYDYYYKTDLINFGMARFLSEEDKNKYATLIDSMTDEDYLNMKVQEILKGFALTIIEYCNQNSLNQLLVSTSKSILFVTENADKIMLNGLLSIKAL